MAAEEDDAIFQVAINESLQSAATRADAGQTTPTEQPSGEANEAQVPPRVTIDDMIGKLASRNTAELPGFDDPQGDTWIFIDAAPQQPEQDHLDYEHYVKRCATPFRLTKETLMRLNSPVINSAFGPTAQFRLLRRRKLVDKLPEGIKYVIDLTPPSEGEDAVWLISSLSCSEGVRLWYRSATIWDISSRLVGGEEEYTSVRSNAVRTNETVSYGIDPMVPMYVVDAFQNDSKDSNLASSSNSGQSASVPVSRGGIRRTSQCPEYSPIRHRAAVERLLASAAGADPKLDSAPKLWTTFAVAKHLGVVRSPLTDYVVTWLRTYPNSVFLEVLTEVSHIMADQLEVYDLARETFAMLVGEAALDSMVQSRILQSHRSHSTFGRKKEDLPEHIQTRVEYASKNFTERIVADYEELKGVGWIESLPEFEKLSSYTQPELQTSVSQLKSSLAYWVQGAIMCTQHSQYNMVPDSQVPPHRDEDLLPKWNVKEVFNSLSPEERVLTRTFWTALERLELFNGFSNLDIQPEWEETVVLNRNISEPTLAEDGYQRIKRRVLSSIVTAGQDQLDRLEQINDRITETDYTEDLSTSIPESLSAHVPTEAAKNLPLMESLPMRPKFEQRSILADCADNQTTWDKGFHGGDDERVSWALAGSSNPSWPAPEGFVDWAAKEQAPTDTDTHNMLSPAPEQTTRPLIESPLAGEEYTLPKTDIEEQNALADWAESTYRDLPVGDNESQTSDTAPLLKKTNDLLSRIAISSEERQLYEKHGTKRSADTYQLELDASTTSTNKPNHFSPKKPKMPKKIEFFNLAKFFSEATEHVRMVAHLKLSYTDSINGRREPYELKLINTLVCLDDPEFKYLPLWAGGCDDDTGGVFNDDVAIPDVSFATAGPSIQHGAGMHTVSECDTVSLNGVPRGIATPTSSVPSSEYHLVKDETSTIVPSSNHTTAGYFSDKLGSDQVYAADSVDSSSVSGDDFSVVARSEGMNPDDEEENARREIEAMERIEAEELEAARLAKQERIAPTDDENYADLFGSEDGDDETEDGNASDDTMRDDDDDDDDFDDLEGEGELI